MATTLKKSKSKDNDKKSQKKLEEAKVEETPVELKVDEPEDKGEKTSTATEEPIVEDAQQNEEPAPEPIYEEPILVQLVVEKYEGDKVKGLYDGQGEACLNGGHHYKGQFSEGLMHGFGVYTWADGIIYTGEFTRNKVTGQGVYNWKDGSSYEGQVLNGLRHGHGTMNYAYGMVYTGQWKQGKQCGTGRFYYDICGDSYYDGDWIDNVRHGTGKRRYPSGNTYEGTWYHNIRHGEGTMRWIDQNQSYSGQWEDGIQHGIGKYTWHLKRGPASQYPMRNTYHGQVCYGKRHGFGIFYYANGSRYEGEWKNDVKCGTGKFVFKNGRVYEGMFEDDHMVEYPQFEMDGMTTPDISQIRTRTPLLSECSSFHSNASINTFSPSFQLDIENLLNEFSENDREEEALQVRFALLRHMTGLHRIYIFYSHLGVDDSEDNTYLMNQMQFWRFIKDCRLHHYDYGLVDMDRWLAREPSRFKEMHSPDRQVLFREFLNHLVVLAFHIHHANCSGSGPVLAECLSRLMTENVLRNACLVKGHFYHKAERAANALAHLDDALNAYKALCSPRKRNPPDRVVTMRQFLHLLQDMNLISKELTAKAVIEVLTSDDPKVRDQNGAINLELEMGFLDFFEALIGCAEIYVTEAVIRVPSASDLLDPPEIQPYAQLSSSRKSPTQAKSPSRSETMLSRLSNEGSHHSKLVEDDLDKQRSSVLLAASNGRESSSKMTSAEDLAEEKEPSVDKVYDSTQGKVEDTEHLAATFSFFEQRSRCDLDKDYGITASMLIDEETRRFNFWTHQLHIFFIRKFFPAVEKFLTIKKLAKTMKRENTAGC